MTGPEAMRRVVLLGFPLQLMDRARKHRDALLREFAFLVHGEDNTGVPQRLLDIASVSEEHYADLNPESEDLCDEAMARGEEYIDLVLLVPDDFRDHIINAIPILIEVENYCRTGQMLTLVPPEDLRQFWTWYLSEFVRQIEGQSPIRWTDYAAAPS